MMKYCDQQAASLFSAKLSPGTRCVPVTLVLLALFAVSFFGPSFASRAADSTNAPANAATNATTAAQLLDLPIDQLVKVEYIEVTSVAKKVTRLEQSPAAISVVTQEDMQRLGITTVPEALRMVPGIDVARIDSHEWAISARGFDAQFANKLLILVDGRTIYGPAYGGVSWGTQDMVIQDLDRIEVIRGPGASLWGANAVNGVVNILSKSSRETQGLLVSTDVGTEDRPTTSIRYGDQIDTNLYYRAYLKYFDREGLVLSDGSSAMDQWNGIRGGARMDWEPPTGDKFTLQGDYYSDFLHDNENVVILAPPYVQNTNALNHDYGMNMLGRWTREFSENSGLSIQAYFDKFKKEQVGTSETRNTFDLDAQHRFEIGTRNDIIWGLGYRYTEDRFPSDFYLTWLPDHRRDDLFSAFVQDDITLAPDRLHVTLGSKFEHNAYTGYEVQPSGRLLWTPSERQTIWAAVSRAVRTPTRYETGARVNYSVFTLPPGSPAPLGLATLIGNPNVQSEELAAYEIGYRIEPTRRLSFDLATFYNHYDHLLRYVPNPQIDLIPVVVYPQTLQNSGSADSYGAELSAQWKMLDNWKVSASYSWMQVKLHPDDPSFQGNPEYQVKFRSYLDLPYNLEFNTAVYYMSQQTAAAGLGEATIPSYVRLDQGLVWHPYHRLEIGLWGENLLDNQHPEFPSLKSSLQTEIPRTFTGRVTIKF